MFIIYVHLLQHVNITASTLALGDDTVMRYLKIATVSIS